MKKANELFIEIFKSTFVGNPKAKVLSGRNRIMFGGIPIDIIFTIENEEERDGKLFISGFADICHGLSCNNFPSVKTIESRKDLTVRFDNKSIIEILDKVSQEYKSYREDNINDILKFVDYTVGQIDALKQNSKNIKKEDSETLTYLSLISILEENHKAGSIPLSESLINFIKINKNNLKNYETSLKLLDAIKTTLIYDRSQILNSVVPYLHKDALLCFVRENQSTIILKRNLANFLDNQIEHYKFLDISNSVKGAHLKRIKVVKRMNVGMVRKISELKGNLEEVDQIFSYSRDIIDFKLERQIECKDFSIKSIKRSNSFFRKVREDSEIITFREWIIREISRGKLTSKEGGLLKKALDVKEYV